MQSHQKLIEVILLDKIIIQNSINVDYPFIQIIGERYSDQNKFDQIIIQNSIFQSNNLIITQLNRISSIISIQTSLDTQIEAKNITFKDNLLNKFEDDPQLHSSSTLFIDSQIGSVVFQNIRFLSNSVLNTSDSNLYIKTDNLTLSECHFSNQNMLNMQLIQQYILFEEFQSEKEKIMSNILVIFSTGGSGLFYINKLLIQQINVTNSLAVNGGAFFIVVKSIGIIQIQNSTFENTSTLLDGNQFSSGGAFYIDASKSRLILSISDTIIQKAYSRTQGGAIYIEASRAFNEINFINLQIENSFSLQHSILSYYPYKLSSLPSNILINNCSFKSNEHEFNYYLSKIQDISIQDVQPFQINNPAIYTQFSNFSIFNTQFNSIHLSFLIQIQHGINVNLINISISNTTIFKSPLIKILLREDVNAQLNVENLKVNFIQEYKFQQILNCTPEKRDDQYKFLCPINASTIISRPNLIFHQQDATNQLNCNKDLVYTQSQYNFSLFELKKSSQTHKIVFYNIQFTQCDCPSCYFGLVSIQEFSFSTLNLKLKSMQFLNNNCGTLGCLSILKVVENNTSINQGSNRILTDDDLSKLEFQQLYNFQVKMQDSIFYNNTAQFGGACYFSSVNILLDNCRMKFNLAYETGGGIFVNANNTRIIIINSEIVNNKANIAGGLYLKNDQLQNPQQLHLILKENYANISENSYEAPTSLKTQIQNQIIDKSVNLLKNSTTIIDEVLITPYQSLDGSQILTQLLLPSGMRISHYKYFDSQLNGYRSSNLTFRILPFNSIGEQIKNLNGSYCSIFAQEISTKNDDYFKQILLDENLSQQYLSQTKILFNQTTQNYNLDELIIYFNPMKDIDSKLLLAIKCDSIQV